MKARKKWEKKSFFFCYMFGGAGISNYFFKSCITLVTNIKITLDKNNGV